MKKLLIGLVLVMGFMACDNDDDTPTTESLDLAISGLDNLGSDYAYEGWIIVDGEAISTGVFTVDDDGNMSKTSFSLDMADLDGATTFVLTIEPSPDNDAGPSSVHILAGDFDGSSASLTVGHGAALGSDFTDATGGYILATPTDGTMMTDENSGVWWLNPGEGPGPALSLPTLPAGWAYEGWAVIDGTPVTTGTFTDVSDFDDDDPYSSQASLGPPFPGEDFLMNAPNGLSFPVDLSERTIVISVEPVPDNSAAPFTLKPLVGMVPASAADHVLYDMSNNAAATNPVGTATK